MGQETEEKRGDGDTNGPEKSKENSQKGLNEHYWKGRRTTQ